MSALSRISPAALSAIFILVSGLLMSAPAKAQVYPYVDCNNPNYYQYCQAYYAWYNWYYAPMIMNMLILITAMAFR
jgi:hypothetical protein